jgi:hypothetical protein
MSLLPAGWPFYAFTDVLGVVLTALIMYWLTTRRHPLLRKIGLKDGFYSNNYLMKAGGEIFRLDFNGNDAMDGIKNMMSGIFGKPNVKELIRERIRTEVVENVVDSALDNEVMKIKIKEMVSEVFKEEMEEIMREKPKEQKNE